MPALVDTPQQDRGSSTGSRKNITDDGGDAKKAKESAFLSWLRENGAKLDSIEWPSCKTGSGVRGAVARRDIETMETMVEIPRRLMMSQLHAQEDPELGHVYREKPSVLKSDNSLAIYVMQEMLKGRDSFYWPYLCILPKPRNLGHWDSSSLLELQDAKLVRRSAARRRHLRAMHAHTMTILSADYPGLFPIERYTFELFDFAWGTIQARAFGKRLSCSALVPLADCLNHGNVQTKYDFNVGGNEVFRVFPSGSNHYPRNTEVLNSYGRRTNDVLLLEYGFAMLDNEWDEVELSCSLSQWEPLFDRRKAALRASGQHTSRVFRLRRDLWMTELLHFHRCASLCEADYENLDAAQRARYVRQHAQHAPCSCCPPTAPSTPTPLSADGDTQTKGGSQAVASFDLERPREPKDRSVKYTVDETTAAGISGDSLPRSDNGKSREKQDGGDGAAEDGSKREEFPFRALSAENELAALTEVVLSLQDAISTFPTTVEHDQDLLQNISNAGNRPPDLHSALVYRITTKRVLGRQLHMAEKAIGAVQAIVQQRDEHSKAASVNGVAQQRCSTAENTSALGQLPVLTRNFEIVDDKSNINNALPPSFCAYLADLQIDLSAASPRCYEKSKQSVRCIKGKPGAEMGGRAEARDKKRASTTRGGLVPRIVD